MKSEVAARQTNMRADGAHIRLYPNLIKGKFFLWRKYFAWFLIAIYFTLPWVTWGGFPLFQLDVYDRKMILFGAFFYPGDIAKFLPFILGSLLIIFAVTSVFGRVWCGWACPQTVFLQYIFEPIETFFEGPAHKRQKRNAEKNDKYHRRKIIKHTFYFLFSLHVANTFLAYFVGIHNVIQWTWASPLENWGAFLFVLADAAIFYFIFAHFREQACTLACPYARLQGVLTDTQTLQVAYDHHRGEPRGKPKRKKKTDEKPSIESAFGAQPEEGDCVACDACVKVCPTGIDIRQGNQLECIGCTRCIDACDSIMTAWKKPTGLISYTSEDAVEKHEKNKILKPRFWIYLFLITTAYSIFGYLMVTRPMEMIDVTRKGTAPYITQGDTIVNYFHLRIRNKDVRARDYKVMPIESSVHNLSGDTLRLKTTELGSYTLLVKTHVESFKFGKKEVEVIVNNGEENQHIETTLAGPFRN